MKYYLFTNAIQQFFLIKFLESIQSICIPKTASHFETSSRCLGISETGSYQAMIKVVNFPTLVSRQAERPSQIEGAVLLVLAVLRVQDLIVKIWSRSDKTCLRGIRQSETETNLLGYRDKLEN